MSFLFSALTSSTTVVDTKEDIKPVLNTTIESTTPILPVQLPQQQSAAVAPLPAAGQTIPAPITNGTLTTTALVGDTAVTNGGTSIAIAAPTVQPTTQPLQTTLPTIEDAKEKAPPPKAMVKPQVLTHVIEDFVIQESSEPFPVSRPGVTNDLKTSHANDKDLSDEPPRKKHAGNNNLYPKGDMAKCELCGTIDLRAKFKKNKRFCSMACAKG